MPVEQRCCRVLAGELDEALVDDHPRAPAGGGAQHLAQQLARHHAARGVVGGAEEHHVDVRLDVVEDPLGYAEVLARHQAMVHDARVDLADGVLVAVEARRAQERLVRAERRGYAHERIGRARRDDDLLGRDVFPRRQRLHDGRARRVGVVREVRGGHLHRADDLHGGTQGVEAHREVEFGVRSARHRVRVEPLAHRDLPAFVNRPMNAAAPRPRMAVAYMSLLARTMSSASTGLVASPIVGFSTYSPK